MSTCCNHCLGYNDYTQAPSLTHHTPRNAFQAQSAQPRLRVFDLCNLVHMLQTNCAHRALDCVSHCWTAGTGLALLPVVVVHRPGYITGTSDLVLGGEHARCAEQ
jgi:hypothetical protein